MGGESSIGSKERGEDAAYYDWCKEEALRWGSDGCTLASEWNQPCCYEHDLGCHYGKDPRDAYKRFLAGEEGYWIYASKLSRRAADKRFAKCNRSRSGLFGDIRSFFRYIGVRLGAWF